MSSSYWHLDQKYGSIFINVKVKAAAKISKIVGLYNFNNTNFLHIKVKEIPENNKANKSVIKLIAQWLAVPQSKIEIVSGLHNNLKVVSISNANNQFLIEKLKQYHL